MSETVALALITGMTGLGGALIGALAMTRVERRREARKRSGVLNAIRMDVIRWMEGCLSTADEWNLRAHSGMNVPWSEFAADASVHLPRGLTAILFRLYQAREQSESAYQDLIRGIPSDQASAAFSARYSLRRWALMARAALEEWDRYYGRSRWKRFVSRWRPDQLERSTLDSEIAALGRLIGRTKQLLEKEYAYVLDDDLELLPENHNEEAYRAMESDFLTVQNKAARSADAPTLSGSEQR